MGIRNISSRILSLADLDCLNEILKTGVPVENALNLIESKENGDIIENMLLYLSKGTEIGQILVYHLPKGLALYFSPFMKLLPFSKALNLSLSFYREEKESTDNLLKNVSYPLILLFASLSGLFLFDCFGLDSIMSMVQSFTEDIRSYEIIRLSIRILVFFFYSMLLFGGVLAAYFSRPRRQFLFYRFLSDKSDLVRTCFTSQLMKFMLLALRNGCSTKEALELIRSVRERPIISALAFQLDEGLLAGKNLAESTESGLYDPLFSRYLKISSASLDNRKMLENYGRIIEKKIEKKLKKISQTVQLSTYVLIGIIIIFIYQILFMPLQAISQF